MKDFIVFKKYLKNFAPQKNDKKIQELEHEILKQHEAGSKQRETIDKLRDKISKQNEVIQRQHEAKSKQRDVIHNQRQAIGKLRETISSHNDIKDKQRDLAIKQRKSIVSLKKTIEICSPNMPMNRFLSFARQCELNAEALKADVYCGHGVQTLPAIHILSQINGGISMCDVIEVPDFSKRAVKSSWQPTTLNTIDAASDGYLRQTSQLITVGWELRKLLLDKNKNIGVLPNYRNYSKPNQSNQLRQQFNISKNDKIVICISTIASSFEIVLEAMQRLPEDIHLVTLGKFAPASYETSVLSLAKKLNISDRVHFSPPVDYSELTSIASEADLGLIVLDPSIVNNKISLPNRVFDYMAAQLPVLSPNVKDISKIICNNEFGKTIGRNTAKNWADAILEILPLTDEMSKNAAKAHEKLCWENLEPSILKLFGNPKSVTFLGYSDLAENNRTMRIADTLIKNGIKVKVAGPIDIKNTNNSDIDWHVLPRE